MERLNFMSYRTTWAIAPQKIIPGLHRMEKSERAVSQLKSTWGSAKLNGTMKPKPTVEGYIQTVQTLQSTLSHQDTAVKNRVKTPNRWRSDLKWWNEVGKLQYAHVHNFWSEYSYRSKFDSVAPDKKIPYLWVHLKIPFLDRSSRELYITKCRNTSYMIDQGERERDERGRKQWLREMNSFGQPKPSYN